MDMRRILPITLLLALTACGGGTGATDYGSAKEVAAAAGCAPQRAVPAGEVTMFATDEVSCNGAGYVSVDWFKDTGSLASFKHASKGAGFAIPYGSDWAISCVDNKDDCAAFQNKIGGSLE